MKRLLLLSLALFASICGLRAMEGKIGPYKPVEKMSKEERAQFIDSLTGLAFEVVLNIVEQQGKPKSRAALAKTLLEGIDSIIVGDSLTTQQLKERRVDAINKLEKIIDEAFLPQITLNIVNETDENLTVETLNVKKEQTRESGVDVVNWNVVGVREKKELKPDEFVHLKIDKDNWFVKRENRVRFKIDGIDLVVSFIFEGDEEEGYKLSAKLAMPREKENPWEPDILGLQTKVVYSDKGQTKDEELRINVTLYIKSKVPSEREGQNFRQFIGTLQDPNLTTLTGKKLD